jgi:EAL domain-containing protein (putative c-di-GMP-specific phosphodiesterase class I)
MIHGHLNPSIISTTLTDVTGQSSLARLGAVPCDRIKIDRSLVVASGEKYHRRTILRYVVKLAQEIGVSVCVEGIEDNEMLDFCRGVGADEGQGFYLGRPSDVSWRCCMKRE